MRRTTKEQRKCHENVRDKPVLSGYRVDCTEKESARPREFAQLRSNPIGAAAALAILQKDDMVTDAAGIPSVDFFARPRRCT